MSRRTVAIVTVNVIVFCVLAELISLLIYYVQNGAVFYSHRKTYALIQDASDQRLAREGLHPYFGPTHESGLPFVVPDDFREERSAVGAPPVETNNFGFVSRYDYPYVKTSDDQFIIGILGGSVGVWFCQVGTNRFLTRLKQNAFFKSKVLIPLCLSHEGYKQPQQLLVLAYFLSIGQQFDVVVNIDGFNEVALSRLNDRSGSDISMPSLLHIDPLKNLVDQSTLTRDKLHSLAAISGYKERLNGLSHTIRENRLASVNFALEQYYKIVAQNYQSELVTFSTLPSNPSDHSLIRVTPQLREREGASLFEDIARHWVRSSMLMRDLLAPRGVAYFHFLQPNQYYTTRPFRDEEARVAINARSPFKEGAAKGYPFLVEASASAWQANDVLFFNGVHIFDDEPLQVYGDDCCHYTLRGNQILADFMAASVLKSRGAWQGGR